MVSGKVRLSADSIVCKENTGTLSLSLASYSSSCRLGEPYSLKSSYTRVAAPNAILGG
ncbi:MAG: hypothetical protein ACHBN1_33470 [Heteroscytonema crispum UTEX LB 1556]